MLGVQRKVWDSYFFTPVRPGTTSYFLNHEKLIVQFNLIAFFKGLSYNKQKCALGSDNIMTFETMSTSHSKTEYWPNVKSTEPFLSD